MTLVRLLMIVVAFFALSMASAHSTEPSSKAEVSANLQQAKIGANEIAELAVLRAQLEDARRFQEQILNTVWWALSCVVALGVLLVGYGWFTNQKAYERDRNALAEDVRKDSERAQAQLVAAIKDQQELSEKGLRDLVEQRVEGIKRGIQRQVNGIANDVIELQVAEKKAKRQEWLSSGTYRNVLSASTDCLELCVKWKDSFEIGESLDLISRDVHKLLEIQESNVSATVDTFLVKNVIEVLDSVTDSHADIARQLRAKVLTLKTGS